ncbi:MAG: hypothetical protein MUF64_05325 [Polyangiaceae bacterium]|jgi:hypothetical protein|nr:hypothetical protein [Polyangiaceae bacterium]
MRRYFPFLLALSLGGLPLAHGGCGDLLNAKPCSSADDCLTPQACCNAGTILQVEESGGPVCILPDPYSEKFGSIDGCTSFLPHLVEGNPCGRGPADPRGLDGCRAGLSCCPATLTCVRDGACPAQAPEQTQASSLATCASDDECGVPEVCCGITYEKRDGKCTHPKDCGPEGVKVQPGGGQGGSGGTAISLVDEICVAAMCPSSSNSTAAIARCKERFGAGLFLATQGCLTATQNTRSLCSSFYGYGSSRPGREDQPPVLPGECSPNLGASMATWEGAQQLCDRLQTCGILSTYFGSAAACRTALVGLRYESIHRLLLQSQCPSLADLLGRVPAPGDPCFTPGLDCHGLSSCGCKDAGCPTLQNPAVCGP